VVGRHVVDGQMGADVLRVVDVLRVAARASLTVTARAMIAVRASLTVTDRVARASLMATAPAVRGSLTAMIDARGAMMATARVARASLTAMTDVRVARASLTVTAHVARGSLNVMTVAARASSTAMTGARVAMTATARASLMATAHAVRGSLIAMIVARAALIAAIATSRSVRRPRRIVDAQRCSSARVAVSTAKTIRVRLAVMTSGRSSTRARCADRESVMFAAMSVAQPTSALAINVLPIAVTAMIGERGDINFLHLVNSKNN
jgi:hypothetical protein